METPSLTEDATEISVLSWLNDLGWETYGGESTRGGAQLNTKYNRHNTEMVYWGILKPKLLQFNDQLTEENIETVKTAFEKDIGPATNLVEANKRLHEWLTNSRHVTIQLKSGQTRSIPITTIDYSELDENSLVAANQVEFTQKTHTIRPDIVLLVNGIPLITGELKALTKGATYEDAISDLKDYEQNVPRAFTPGLFTFAADSMDFRYGAIGAPREHFQPWNPDHDKPTEESALNEAVNDLLQPQRLLDILKTYVFYEETSDGYAKIIPRYMQYQATTKVLQKIHDGDTQKATRGLVWHTQGSGKSYTMLYTADNLLNAPWFETPQIVIVVDTDDLRSQLSDTLNRINHSKFTVASSKTHLHDLLRNGHNGVVVTTIQMFEEAPKDIQGNENTVILSDEAHRFMEETLGNCLEAALPNAHHYGYTGTPVNQSIRNTFLNFTTDEDRANDGMPFKPYTDRYSLKDGLDDNVILPVHFTVRSDIDWDIDDDIDDEFEALAGPVTDDQRQKLIRDEITRSELAELQPRVEAITEDISSHYRENAGKNWWKAMVVTPSRAAAVKYTQSLEQLLPAEDVQVVITEDDGEFDDEYLTTGEERSNIVRSFKKDDSPKILVVCNMLLTGFDAPVLKTMYLDRNLKRHNLLQAIARVNRPADGKHNGQIVDYAGALSNLDDALGYDDETVQRYALFDEETLLDDFKETLNEAEDFFSDVNADTPVDECINQVNRDPKKGRFKKQVRHLQELFETISPHKELRPYHKRYQWLTDIYTALNELDRTKTDPGLAEKTKELIEVHSEFGEVHNDYPEYQLNASVLEKDTAPQIQVMHKLGGLEELTEQRKAKNPRYGRLSDKLNKVLAEWNNGAAASNVLERLENIEEEARNIEQHGGTDLNAAEYALYVMLKDEYADHFEQDSEIEEVAKAIEAKFKDCVNLNQSWVSHPRTQKEIRQAVTRGLIESGHIELHSEEFVADVQGYLVSNHSAATV